MLGVRASFAVVQMAARTVPSEQVVSVDRRLTLRQAAYDIVLQRIATAEHNRGRG